MSGYYDRLQGTDRLLRIRRLRKALFAGIVALSVLLVVARMGSQGASIKPLFLPVNGIIEIALIMGFVTAIVGLFLRNLEIRHAQRDGQRYLMAKSCLARAIRTAGFTTGLAVVLLLAVTPSLTASLFSDAPQNLHLGPRNQEAVAFTSPDPLGVSFVTHATVIVTQGQALVTLLRNNVSLARVNLSAPERDTLDVEPTMWEGFASWSLMVQNTFGNDTYLTFVLEKGVVPTLFSTVPFLLFLYGGTQVAWWIVLRPIRDRTKAGSLSVATDVDESERVYDDTVQSPNPDTNPGPQPAADPDIFNIAAASTPAVEVEAPPPPVRTRVPAPPPRVETPKPAPRPVVRQPETAASLATKAGAPRRVRRSAGHGPEGRQSAAEDRAGPRRRAGPIEPRAHRERERELPAGPEPVRRHLGGGAEQRERAHRQGGRLPKEREAAGSGELPRPSPGRPAEQRLGPPEPREHPARRRRPRERTRRVRPSHAALSERRGGVGGAGRRAREDGPRRRRLAGVHGGAPEEPGGRGRPAADPRARGREDGSTGHLRGPRGDQGDRKDAGEGPDRRRIPERGGLREGEREGPHGRERHH